MKILKPILLALVAIIVVALVAAAFIPNEYHVERTIVISRPQAEVFDYVRLLKNQDNFSKWAKMDPNSVKTYTGTDGEVGFISAWESTNPDVGKGEQEITKITTNERIDYELRFIEPFMSKSPAYFTFSPAANGATSVTWGFDGDMEYPTNLFLLVMDMEAMLGSDFEEGLQNLKEILEA